MEYDNSEGKISVQLLPRVEIPIDVTKLIRTRVILWSVKQYNMENRENRELDPVALLSIFDSGVLTVGVNGLPLLKVDAGSHSVDVEAAGVKECNIRLSSIMKLEGKGSGFTNLLKASNSTAKGLFETGWKFALYDKGQTILTMGRGVSRLTGRMRVNPLKLRRLLEAL